MTFLRKLLRNSLIVGFLYFASNFMIYQKFDWLELKPLVAFVLLYVAAELGQRYNLSLAQSKKGETLLF